MDPSFNSRVENAQGELFCNFDIQPRVLPERWELSPGSFDRLVKETPEMCCPLCCSVLRGRRVRGRVLSASLSRSVVRLRSVSVIRFMGDEPAVEDVVPVLDLPDSLYRLGPSGEIIRPCLS